MNTVQNTSSLLDRLDRDYAPGWIYQLGDKIAGTVVETNIRPADPAKGIRSPYRVVTIQLADGCRGRIKDGWVEAGGEIGIHANNTVLIAEFADANVGDFVAAKYTKVHDKNVDGSYHGFKVLGDHKNRRRAPGAVPVPVDPDVPIDTSDLEPLPAPVPGKTIQARAEDTFGSDIPFGDDDE